VGGGTYCNQKEKVEKRRLTYSQEGVRLRDRTRGGLGRLKKKETGGTPNIWLKKEEEIRHGKKKGVHCFGGIEKTSEMTGKRTQLSAKELPP